ncbi:MAG TPA: hypothetical protein VFD82_16255 [Planctomycetota bacterium]|nr:hypothetical protein [Planctomycetota bacterium]
MSSRSRQSQSVHSAASSLVALLAGFLPAQGGYTFALDGKPTGFGFALDVRSGIVSLQGTPGAPAAGDLVWVQAKTDCLVRLAEPGHYEFFDETKENGRVRLRRGDREQIAVLDSKRLVESDEATRRELLGVVVLHWDDAVAAAVGALDPSVPLVVTDGTAIGEQRALPALPSGIHHLALCYETSEGFGDLTAAAKLTNLRTLYLGGQYCGFTKIDIRPFASAVLLRVFHCEQPRLVGTEIVEGFRELRSFAAKDFPLATFELLRGMTELRRVYCWGPDADDVPPRSLAPLAGLPRLEHIELMFTPIGELPATGFDRLRTLYLQGCGVPAAQQRAFRKAHPECAIDGEVDDEQLQTLLATADRLVLRTRGTCHRDEASEKVLFDTTAPDDIAKVLPLLHVVEDGSDFHCMCCGSPTLMFFKAGKEIASIGVHHGASIRWADGLWSSDALLTREAAEGLVQWLSDHGDDRPMFERRRSQARREAGPRRARLRAAVFGAKVADDADLDALREEWLKQAAAAAATDGGFTQLRLLGCHEGAWDAPDEFDQALLAGAVESLKGDTAWNGVHARCRADERAALGLAAVWVTREGEQLAPARRAEALPIIAPAALRSPQPWNRARMLQQLRDDPSEAACDVLIAALDGRFAPRQVRDEELIAPGGMVMVHPGDPVLDARKASTQALAALCLAARKHTASLQRIQELAKNATPRDAEILRQAAEQLQAAK